MKEIAKESRTKHWSPNFKYIPITETDYETAFSWVDVFDQAFTNFDVHLITVCMQINVFINM